MITIDGSRGEGGGQVLRTSLALSMLTGTPLTLENVRGRRSRPGLLRQHLTALRAATEVSGAEVTGAELRSSRVQFVPSGIRAGCYGFAIGSAGSANLVLQTVLPALFAAPGPSQIVVEGGTHNDKSPPFHFLERAFAPCLLGPRLSLTLDRWGFYPAGGGQITARVTPAPFEPFELVEPEPIELSAHAAVSNLASSIARRELQELARRMEIPKERLHLHDVPGRGPGNVCWVEAKSARFAAVFTGFGRKRTPAERVAAEVADEVVRWQASGAPVGAYLADQLLIPMALAGEGAMRTVAPSLHTLTNIEVIERFLPVRFESEDLGGSWLLRCRQR